MQIHKILSSSFIAAALLGAPSSGFAAPTDTQATLARQAKPAAASDAARYAEREKQSPTTATFEGGGESIYIGGGALTLVLVILLIVIVL